MAQTVLVGVTGGIAAYKAATICSLLTKQGYAVQVLMTEHATRFIQPLTFQSLTKRAVITDTFEEPNPSEIAHIALADQAALYLIAPATANVIAKLAHGIADDMVTTTALACQAPLLIAPAMNVHMLEHPAVQENLHILRGRGAVVVDSGTGPLACGYTGKGRLAEPEDIVDIVHAVLSRRKDLQGIRMLVTAGPTVEDIDPVRFLSNASTGKMGYAIAEAAAARGAHVDLVSGPTGLNPPNGVVRTQVRSTQDMLEAVQSRVGDVQVLIGAAAPADFRPVHRGEHKWKKSEGIPHLELEPTPDILATVAAVKRDGQIFVGFAAETRDVEKYGQDKLVRKNLDMVVANDVTQPGAGFGTDTNTVSLLYREGRVERLPMMAKRAVADHILDQVTRMLKNSDGSRGEP